MLCTEITEGAGVILLSQLVKPDLLLVSHAVAAASRPRRLENKQTLIIRKRDEGEDSILEFLPLRPAPF